MTQKLDITPYQVSFNPDDSCFYLCDTSTEDGAAGIPIQKEDGKPAIYQTSTAATSYARKLLKVSWHG